MTRSLDAIAAFLRATDGQDLLEYALLMALIAIVAVLAVNALGMTVTNILWAPIVSAI